MSTATPAKWRRRPSMWPSPTTATTSPFVSARCRNFDAVLPRDPDLELREQGERREAPGPGLAAHQRVVSGRIQLEGDHARPAREDFRADRGADVEDVADAEENDHPLRRNASGL